jgi:hypothetical protein
VIGVVMQVAVEVIEIDLIGISRDIVASLDDDMKSRIKKVNLALKDKDTITYIFTLINNKNDTFEVTINRCDIHLLKDTFLLFLDALKNKKLI